MTRARWRLAALVAGAWYGTGPAGAGGRSMACWATAAVVAAAVRVRGRRRVLG
jgi:hypothetical protein